MRSALAPDTLAEVIPGTWRVAASNEVHWISGNRVDPVVTVALVSREPLTVSVATRFVTGEGKKRAVLSTARWASDGFIERRKGLARFAPSRWIVRGMSPDGSVLVIVHQLRQSAGDGIEVLIRSGTDADGLPRRPDRQPADVRAPPAVRAGSPAHRTGPQRISDP